MSTNAKGDSVMRKRYPEQGNDPLFLFPLTTSNKHEEADHGDGAEKDDDEGEIRVHES